MAKGRILAIDDELFFRELYSDLLSAEGYYVRTVAGGEEALEALRRDAFDLVVTDMEMPGMNGLETVEAIRRQHPEQELLVVTGQRDATPAVEALRRGVAGYLLKPVNSDELLLSIGRILFRQSQQREQLRTQRENAESQAVLAAFRRCLVLLEAHGIDRLGDLLLDILMEQLRAEGGALWLQEHGGRQLRLRCRRGLVQPATQEAVFRPAEELRRQLLTGEPAADGEGTRLWVPLQIGVEPLAAARIESPVGRSAFGREDMAVAATIARFAASQMRNVLQLRRLEHDALRQSRGEAYTMAFYRDHAEKELLKARRYGRSLSLVRLRIDNYAELNRRFRGLELEEAILRLGRRVQSVLRDADIMAQEAPDELHLLLPETDHWGSLVAQKRIRRALRGELSLCDMKKSYPIRLSLRSATFPGDGESLDALERVAADRLERLQQSLLLRGRLEELPFWEVVGRLFGGSGDLRLEEGGVRLPAAQAAFEEAGRSRYWRMPAGQFERVLETFCGELGETGRARGLLYCGCDDFDRMRTVLRNPEGVEKSATTLYLLGGRQRVVWEYQRILPIHIADGNFARMPFLLYLNEESAYALFARPEGREMIGFHSADFYFVENMIVKLQEQYQLQAHI